MRVLKYELCKLFRFPLMWGLLVLFVSFNIYIIYSEVGYSEYQKSLNGVYDVITGQADSGEYFELYTEYKNSVSGSYDTLDMQKIKQMKEDMTGFVPSGCYQEFIDKNYDKLQNKLKQIKADGDTIGDFYPGDVFRIHKKLYLVMKLCIIEMLLMMCFSVLYLMDYERLNKTEELVYASNIGRRAMCIKKIIGIIGGLVFSGLLLFVSLAVFFSFVPMKGLWQTPVSSVMVMESSGIWEYPFITFVRLNIGQEFAIGIILSLMLTLLIGIFSSAVRLFVNNSYITLVGTSAGFVGLFLLPVAIKSVSYIKTAACLNPATLWYYCGRWFIENDLPVSFAWSEFITLGIWFIITAVIMLFGRCYLKTRDI